MKVAVCKTCGAELRPGARYCVACGASVSGNDIETPIENEGKQAASDVEKAAGQDNDAADVSPDSSRRRRKASFLVVAFALVAVVTVVLISRGISGSGGVVNYWADQAASVASTTQIVPMRREGEPLTKYQVRIFGDGLDGGPQEFDVAGEEGFKIQDISDNLPNGSYQMVISDDEGCEWELSLDVVDSISEESITLLPGQEAIGSDEAYCQKIKSLVDEYGDSENAVSHVMTSELGLETQQDVDAAISYGTGLCYAELVDFGDGADRLVVAYRVSDEQNDKVPQASDYRLEVWEYQEDADALRCVADADSGLEVSRDRATNSGSLCIDYQLRPDESSLVLYSEYSVEALHSGIDEAWKQMVFGLDDAGEFGKLADTRVERTDRADKYDVDYYINDEPSSFTEQYDVLDIYFTDIFSVDPYTSFDLSNLYLYGDETLKNTYAEYGNSGPEIAGYKVAGQYELRTTLSTVSKTLDTLENGSKGSQQVRKYHPDDVAHTIDVEVELPILKHYKEESNGVADWNYVELHDIGSDEGLDIINNTLADSFKFEVEAAQSWVLDGLDYTAMNDQAISYRSSLTYAADDAVAVTRSRTILREVDESEDTRFDCLIVNPQTGERMFAWDLVGMTRIEMHDAAVSAMTTAIESSADNRPSDIKEKGGDLSVWIVNGEGERYIVSEAGISLIVEAADYGLDGEGSREILIVPFEDGLSAGDDITEMHSYFGT